MRNKKPMHNNNYNNRNNRPRYSQGGGHHSNNSHNRPRRNYGAAREKYLAQARDALASGDRVLAENYLQHADHCYRMMMEENANRPQQPRPQPQAGEDSRNLAATETEIPENTSQLPAFLTATYEQSGQQKPAEAPVQNWEERDA